MSSVEAGLESGTPVALFDLGDTLCDCAPALREAMARLRQGREGDDDEVLRQQVLSAPGFWRALPPRKAGFELLCLMREEGFCVHVLTKGPRDAPHVWADKVAWCRFHLPDVPVTVTDDKARVHGHVLVDDWLPYVEGWQAQWPTGLAIIPTQPWNRDATLGSLQIRDDGDQRESIVAELRRVRGSLGTLPN